MLKNGDIKVAKEPSNVDPNSGRKLNENQVINVNHQ